MNAHTAQAFHPAVLDGECSAGVVPAGAGPIRGRRGSCMTKKVLMRQRLRASVVARERGLENAGAAPALPQLRDAVPHARVQP